MRFRKLRIAWSVACGVATVLLIALWVRSYWRWDIVFKPNLLVLESIQGHIGVHDSPPLYVLTRGWDHIKYQSDAVARAMWQEWTPHRRKLGFDFAWNSSEHSVVLPIWFLVTLAPAFAALPWLPYSTRFSLHTLLIATTLVAVVLGLIAYAVR